MTIETGVLECYSEGAESRQADLCCPVDYDRELLAILPREIIEKDYGCGDPSRYVKKGDVVLDLKLCCWESPATIEPNISRKYAVARRTLKVLIL